MFYDPMRLRTLATFTAADPWSRNALTEYRVEEYVMMPVGSKRALDSKWNLHTIGIQWEADARYRLLPESLVELWKRGRIPAEKLPSLLHTLEPRLLDTDCLTTQSWQRSLGLPLLVMMLLCPVVFLLIRVHGERMPADSALLSGFFIALLTGLILWIMRTMKLRRVQQQMNWAVNTLSGTSSFPPLESQTKAYLKLGVRLFAAILLGTLALTAAVVVYFHVSG
jgi:hypothetical protein